MQENEFVLSDGTIYAKDYNGAIKQLYPRPYVYNAGYSATYDTPQYQRQSDVLNALRLGFVVSNTSPIERKSIVDCGYGNGAFLKIAREFFSEAWGHDVSGVPVPDGCNFMPHLPTCGQDCDNHVNVITFWDCLEHFPDLSFVENLCADTLIVSLPCCHFNAVDELKGREAAIKWFENWKHRKPDEHLFHFAPNSLRDTMASLGWTYASNFNFMEDVIRKNTIEDEPNILTMAFRRKSLAEVENMPFSDQAKQHWNDLMKKAKSEAEN